MKILLTVQQITSEMVVSGMITTLLIVVDTILPISYQMKCVVLVMEEQIM